MGPATWTINGDAGTEPQTTKQDMKPILQRGKGGDHYLLLLCGFLHHPCSAIRPLCFCLFLAYLGCEGAMLQVTAVGTAAGDAILFRHPHSVAYVRNPLLLSLLLCFGSPPYTQNETIVAPLPPPFASPDSVSASLCPNKQRKYPLKTCSGFFFSTPDKPKRPLVRKKLQPNLCWSRPS